MIVTSQPDEVWQRLIDQLLRGVTVLQETSTFTGADRPDLYCVITRAEVSRLKTTVYEGNPRAFMAIGYAYEALGEEYRQLTS